MCVKFPFVIRDVRHTHINRIRVCAAIRRFINHPKVGSHRSPIIAREKKVPIPHSVKGSLPFLSTARLVKGLVMRHYTKPAMSVSGQPCFAPVVIAAILQLVSCSYKLLYGSQTASFGHDTVSLL